MHFNDYKQQVNNICDNIIDIIYKTDTFVLNVLDIIPNEKLKYGLEINFSNLDTSKVKDIYQSVEELEFDIKQILTNDIKKQFLNSESKFYNFNDSISSFRRLFLLMNRNMHSFIQGYNQHTSSIDGVVANFKYIKNYTGTNGFAEDYLLIYKFIKEIYDFLKAKLNLIKQLSIDECIEFIFKSLGFTTHYKDTLSDLVKCQIVDKNVIKNLFEDYKNIRITSDKCPFVYDCNDLPFDRLRQVLNSIVQQYPGNKQKFYNYARFTEDPDRYKTLIHMTMRVCGLEEKNVKNTFNIILNNLEFLPELKKCEGFYISDNEYFIKDMFSKFNKDGSYFIKLLNNKYFTKLIHFGHVYQDEIRTISGMNFYNYIVEDSKNFEQSLSLIERYGEFLKVIHNNFDDEQVKEIFIDFKNNPNMVNIKSDIIEKLVVLRNLNVTEFLEKNKEEFEEALYKFFGEKGSVEAFAQTIDLIKELSNVKINVANHDIKALIYSLDTLIAFVSEYKAIKQYS
jgi:hypothetical protein